MNVLSWELQGSKKQAHSWDFVGGVRGKVQKVHFWGPKGPLFWGPATPIDLGYGSVKKTRSCPKFRICEMDGGGGGGGWRLSKICVNKEALSHMLTIIISVGHGGHPPFF